MDQFASDHDAQLMFSIRARNASWSPGFVQQALQAQGCHAYQGYLYSRPLPAAQFEALAQRPGWPRLQAGA